MQKNARLFLILLTLLLLTKTSLSQETTKNWYKGNLHTHSLWSDGNDFPEMICKWYKDRGYNFLGLSDHNILSQGEKWIPKSAVLKRGGKTSFDRYRKVFGDEWVEVKGAEGKEQVRLKPLNEFKSLFDEPEKFLMIQAEEITDHFGRLPVHINATNVQDLIKPQGGESLQETIRNNLKAIKRQSERTGRPIFAHLNHPNFGWAVTAMDMAAVEEEKFFEIYNGHPGVNQLGDAKRPGLEKMWDLANSIRVQKMKSQPLFGIATDDSHNYFGRNGSSPGRGWVMVQASRLTPASLIRSLEAGSFYASSGVELDSFDFDQKSNTYSIKIKSKPDVKYTTQFIGTKKGTDLSKVEQVGVVLKTSNSATPSYQLDGSELYVRAVVTSSESHPNPSIKGQKTQAWLQPVQAKAK